MILLIMVICSAAVLILIEVTILISDTLFLAELRKIACIPLDFLTWWHSINLVDFT